jgi:hypothetical protein
VAVCVLGFAFLAAEAQTHALNASGVKVIEIAPAWFGQDRSSPAIVTIRNLHGVFRRTWDPIAIQARGNEMRITTSTGDPSTDEFESSKEVPRTSEDTVSSQSVVALLTALQAPVIGSPELSNLGISHAWLASRSEDAAKRVGNLGEPNDAQQRRFFEKSFTDLALINRLLPQIVGASWTDDPVWVHVSIEFASGDHWTAETTSQPAFMLPWTCKGRGTTIRSFNADVSRAVAALLPKGAINRSRLAGDGLEDLVVRAVEPAIKQRWQQIGAEDKAGNALAVLRQRYQIRRSEVSDHIGLAYGPDQYHDSPHETNLQADVRLASFPTNLTVATVFPIENGNAVGLDNFMHVGAKYEQLVLANPWIMASLRKHSDLGAWLMFVKDASMSEKAVRIFTADMHALGRDDLSQDVSAHRDEVSLLNYYGNELIIFPDHHAIVWRWGPYRELFSWSASSLKTQRCEEYATVTEGCTAAVIDPNGNLKK